MKRLLLPLLATIAFPTALTITPTVSFADHLEPKDLFRASLSGADLSDANLSSINLRSADLSGANLSGAKLNGANLIGANLMNAYFDPEELKKAIR